MAGVNKVIMTDLQKDIFWSKVGITQNTTDCWVWLGAKKPKGYGNVRINKEYLLAHRVAFSISTGQIPDGFIVCHICDNPSCCNPNHLMLGTIKSNAADMVLKNRQAKSFTKARGSMNGNSKLSEEIVRVCRELNNQGTSIKFLSNLYEVSEPTIRSAINGRTWRHVI